MTDHHSNRTRSTRTRAAYRPTDEHVRIAADPEAGRRRLNWIPPLVAAVISIPLLWLAIRFSLLATSTMRDIVLLNDAPGTGFTIGMYIYSACGWLALAGVLACLFIALLRGTRRWRIWWSAGALAFALAVPASWLALGWVF
ncbi:hypothetical protein NQ038_01755 [Brevibacterium sp. 50QC2O2]|uniref:hypothetical protein n=1 Tax=unclassified Brevibacterium TaxID=2614124 RepID=UPI00211CD1F3|nr:MULTISPECIES: hypothetical protein [unclassified Brevibacterium]MCQ9368460.1 hypothetical protein [Brevibacterium sp. 91QC2O2]MCQ9387374.1 hypothetical protein [Brevibacterium sp. 50QC2O2]